MSKKLRILNLGAGGFIGCHLTRRLLDDGHRVVAVDTHADKLEDSLGDPSLVYLEEDIRDPATDLEGWVRDADLVIDLIAHANPGIYVRNPVKVFRLNFLENLRIADYCVAHGKRLIQFSTCEVYGKTLASTGRVPDPENPAYATFSEDTTDLIMGPVGKHRWIYASAKQLLERVLHAYGLEEGLNYTIVRPFNFIGPKIDYLPAETDGVPRVFSYFMEALLTGEPMQLVDGGKHRRCYTYIEDAIDCISRIVANPDGVCDREIFNVGSTDNEVSIRDLAHLMRRLYEEWFRAPGDPLPEIVTVSGEAFYGRGYEDSDRRIPDNRKACERLGWRPRWRLPDMLRETMGYYVDQHRARAAANPRP